ncbi:MAG: YgfZ/GcvT domain-containing protein [Deinococcales bacterium]
MAYVALQTGVLQLLGSDRIPFLHGQCSNDIRNIALGTACTALVLNAKGQIEFEIEVLRRESDLLVFCCAGLEQALFERLKRYIVFDDIQLQIVNEYKLLHHIGKPPTHHLHWQKNRGLPSGFDVLLPIGENVVLEPQNLELARVQAGIPNAHTDGFVGRLPQECGFEFAVSYKKGCYIGQEIMARLEARGQTRYVLRRVRFEAILPVGSVIVQQGKEVGQLGACVEDGTGFVALAVLRRELGDTPLEVGEVRLELV